MIAAIVVASALLGGGSLHAGAPYPRSSVVRGIRWHWEMHSTAAPGSDLWPVTWGPDGHIYTAWGDGGGFGGTNSDGRVSMGFARIEGPPEKYRAVNVNGGKNPKHAASFGKKGKTGGILFVGRRLYARLNLQDGKWPNVNHSLAWSDDFAATWKQTSWRFAKGQGNFKPSRFLNFGRGYAGVPDPLKGYVYFYGFKQTAGGWGCGKSTYLGRVAQDKMTDRSAYQFWAGGKARWSSEVARIRAVFTDPSGATPGTVVYNPALKRYFLTSFHTGPGQLGVFDAPQPWGPWTTVAYEENWGKMGPTGHGLNCDFPQKWISADGRTMWSVFSVYGAGARKGVNAHDRFNLVKATLQLVPPENSVRLSGKGLAPVAMDPHRPYDPAAWLGNADTNLAKSREAHDRIVVTPGTREDFTGTWKVDACFTDHRVSDPWPVWAEFYTDRDTNPN